jgi:hypothetical protein
MDTATYYIGDDMIQDEEDTESKNILMKLFISSFLCGSKKSTNFILPQNEALELLPVWYMDGYTGASRFGFGFAFPPTPIPHHRHLSKPLQDPDYLRWKLSYFCLAIHLTFFLPFISIYLKTIHPFSHSDHCSIFVFSGFGFLRNETNPRKGSKPTYSIPDGY